MKKLIFFTICIMFTFSVNCQDLEKLLDEAKKVVTNDGCTVLKDFTAILSSKVPEKKFSMILNKDQTYSVFLFKSVNSGIAELTIENKDLPNQKKYLVRVQPEENYSFVDMPIKVTGVYHLTFTNKSDSNQDLIGILSIPKYQTKEGHPHFTVKPKWEYEPGDDTSTVYIVVDEMPEFVKGDSNRAFMKWFMENFKYPELAKKNGIQGKVYVQFVVDKTGNVKDIKVLRGLTPEIDEWVINNFKKCPTWQKPGKLHGKNVNVSFTMPVTLKLQ